MLLTSPGDSGSSLPIDSLQPLPTDSSLAGQTSIEGDRVTVTTSLEAFVESYQVPCQLPDESAIGIRPHADASAPPSGIHTVKATRPSRQQLLHPTGWARLPSQERDLDGLYALRQAATIRALRQSRTQSWSLRSLAELTGASAAESIDALSFAAPLSPLRERDLAALSEFFHQDEMLVIEADINQRLLSLLPEPCWEDEAFGFLKEFL